MKKIIISLIKKYQKTPGPWHNSCRFTPTCSNYAIEALTEHGVMKGGIMSFIRVIRCNPLSKGGFDPVRRKHEK